MLQTVINAWARSGVIGKSQRAKTVLQKMIDMYEARTSRARPNVFIYMAGLNVCAFAVGYNAKKVRALQVFMTTFDELCSSDYTEPNYVTYIVYLTALRNLLPDSDKRRVPLLSKVFCKCCEDGPVSQLTLRRLESALTPKQVTEVNHSVGFDRISPLPIGQVPSKWRQNVVEKKSSNKNQSQVLR
jgi:hypothetical protein